MSMLRIMAEQFVKLPVLLGPETCSGKVYIVTGANIGLGLETARHLVQASAARVILACRNTAAGEKAKNDIERSTGRKGTAEVWHLDLASYASIQTFAKKASTQLERIDSFIANAGVMLDKWQTSEGMETCMTVNVISTIFLGALMMPKMTESARNLSIKPRLVFVGSALGFTVQKELAKSGRTNIFDGFNDPKRANMDQRYALTKLVELYAFRELSALFPTERTGVIINMTAPGLCSTGLARDAGTWTRTLLAVLRAMVARTAEQGSRTTLHGVVADEDSHGKFLSGCKIKEFWIPDWITNAEGQREQKQIWKELVIKLEEVQPGCISQNSEYESASGKVV